VWGRRQTAYQSQVNEIIRGMGELAPDRTGREGTRYTAQLAALLMDGLDQAAQAQAGQGFVVDDEDLDRVHRKGTTMRRL
jgi:hypothetical protein